jgi:hypothetical protein
VLLHYARITHSLGISVMFADRDLLFQAAAACHAADALPPPPGSTAPVNPALRCGIAANYNPWGEDASPFPRAAPPTLRGPLEVAELQLCVGLCPICPICPQIQIDAVIISNSNWLDIDAGTASGSAT